MKGYLCATNTPPPFSSSLPPSVAKSVTDTNLSDARGTWLFGTEDDEAFCCMIEFHIHNQLIRKIGNLFSFLAVVFPTGPEDAEEFTTA